VGFIVPSFHDLCFRKKERKLKGTKYEGGEEEYPPQFLVPSGLKDPTHFTQTLTWDGKTRHSPSHQQMDSGQMDGKGEREEKRK
jgi:hypothetical protein